MNEQSVVVVGAGLIGLTTAVRLAEAGHRVEVFTADDPLRTTSTAATGMVGFGFSRPLEKAIGWRQSTVTELSAQFGRGVGVRTQPGLLAGRDPFEAPKAFHSLPGFRIAEPAELPDGFRPGFWVDMIAVDLDRYLPYLVDRLRATGTVLTRTTVDDLAAIDAPVIVNCCGIGAKGLVDDPELRADWGMHLIIENAVELQHHFMEMSSGLRRWISWMPHGDRILIGGASVLDRTDPAPDATIAAELTGMLQRTHPALASAPSIGVNAGVRPHRSAVRVEATSLPDGRTLIHNYGHGGSGLTLSWGSADEVLTLVTDGHPTERPD
ncbi:MAG: FAD-dependent oxidoreductase [Actinomycetota bacterium]